MEDASEAVGVRALEECLADPIADADPSAGDQDVLVSDLDARLTKQPAHFHEVRLQVPLVHDGVGV